MAVQETDGKQTAMRIDMNSDMGESFGRWTLGDDEALLDVVSSANVACGFHAGDPSAIGIDDIMHPDYGDAPVLEPGDVPVFWACGVTPQAAVMASKPEFAITHAPGHMFITSKRDLEYMV